MANGEGLFERLIGLVQWRSEGEKEVVDKAKEVEKGIAGVAKTTEKALSDAQQRLVSYGQALQAGGANLQDLATEFKSAGASADDMRIILGELGYTTKEISEVLGEDLPKGVRRVDWSFKSLAQSIQFAVYRFITALVIYQTFRKIFRAINEAIERAIRLWREFSRAQIELAASIEAVNAILGTQTLTLEEWNQWITQASEAWGSTITMWGNAVALALRMNATLGLTNDQVQALVITGRNAAIMWGMWKDELPDVEKGLTLIFQAIEGQEAALTKLGIKEQDIIDFAREEGLVWDKLTEDRQDQIRAIYIIAQRYEQLGESAEAALTDIDRASMKLVTANDNLSASWGEIWNKITEAGRIIKVFTIGPLFALVGKIYEAIDAVNKFVISIGTLIGQGIERLIQRVPVLNIILGRLQGTFQSLFPTFFETGKGFRDLSKATMDAADAALSGARQWLYYRNVLENMLGFVDKAKDIMADAKDKFDEWKESIDDDKLVRLTESLFRAIWAFRQGIAALGDLRTAVAELWAEFDKAEQKLTERYAERAVELRERAQERIQDLIDRANERREDAEADLLLRLKHMEEDYLLAMKQLREQYVMDIEEAARARDWRAIRTLQRRYALEKKQRKEDYQLSRKQYIESWEQRNKVNEKQLDLEIKRINEALAKELKALEEEKEEELKELEDSYKEREAELRQQYAKQYQDLKDNLERQLAEIIARWMEEEDLTDTQAKAITRLMASQYGLREADIWNHVEEYRNALIWLRDQVSTIMGDIMSYYAQWPFPTEPWPTPTPITPTPSPRPTPTPQTAQERCLALWPDYYWTGTRCVRAFRMAEGGSFVTRGPTRILAGERGPELVNVIPLQKGGSVLAGMRSYIGGDFRLTIDGSQAGNWGVDFEGNVLNIVRNIFEEAFER